MFCVSEWFEVRPNDYVQIFRTYMKQKWFVFVRLVVWSFSTGHTLARDFTVFWKCSRNLSVHAYSLPLISGKVERVGVS